MTDSRSLKLMRRLAEAEHSVTNWLLRRLHEDGFAGLTASQLSFLGQLDCGANHASALARDLGISRQAVHKTVAELEARGWLRLSRDPSFRNQKVITFTGSGERMMAQAREHFLALDDMLGRDTLTQLGVSLRLLSEVVD